MNLKGKYQKNIAFRHWNWCCALHLPIGGVHTRKTLLDARNTEG